MTSGRVARKPTFVRVAGSLLLSQYESLTEPLEVRELELTLCEHHFKKSWFTVCLFSLLFFVVIVLFSL